MESEPEWMRSLVDSIRPEDLRNWIKQETLWKKLRKKANFWKNIFVLNAIPLSVMTARIMWLPFSRITISRLDTSFFIIWAIFLPSTLACGYKWIKEEVVWEKELLPIWEKATKEMLR